MDNTQGAYIWKTFDVLRGSMEQSRAYMAFIAACYSKRVLGDDIRSELAMSLLDKRIANKRILHFIVNHLFVSSGGEKMLDIVTLLNLLPEDVSELDSLILDTNLEVEMSNAKNGYWSTPSSLTNLAIEILDIKPSETVADFGTGTGSFLVRVASGKLGKKLYGYDINTDMSAIAMIRADVLGDTVSIEQADMFHVEGEFDKCFSNYPFGMNDSRFKEEKRLELEQAGITKIPRFHSSDWLFSMQILSKIKPKGKAIGIMTSGSSFNSADAKIREYFIGKGWIEAVVALPAGLFSPYTGISTNMIVLSQGNETIRMVDATDIYQRGRRVCYFNSTDIERIIGLLAHDEKSFSHLVTYEELVAGGFNLDPTRYTAERVKVKNGIPLSDVALDVTRGSGITSNQLEKLNSKVPTDFRYLMLQNIIDGCIEPDLPYLTKIDSSLKKYCVKSGDLVLSKIGPNFKVAVADVPDYESVLATGNLYILRLDRNKVDPLFIKAYLETEEGLSQLRRECVGTTMQSLPIKAFSEIEIPLIPMEEQYKIASRYRLLQQEIDAHKFAIEKAKRKMASILDER